MVILGYLTLLLQMPVGGIWFRVSAGLTRYINHDNIRFGNSSFERHDLIRRAIGKCELAN